MDRLLCLLQQQATALEDLSTELDADNRLMQSRMNELSAKLDAMTTSLINSVITSSVNSDCILSDYSAIMRS